MALHLPPAVSYSRFIGGYKAVSDYNDLADTETNDAQNTIYGPNGDIDQRLGMRKLLSVKLANSATPTVGEPITGHYHFDKLGVSSTFNIVAAGNSLYNYNSSTASVIATGLTDNSETYWNFVQTQDPRSATDDIVIGTNGVDAIRVWTGSGTAVLLSSFTSASGVPVAKYLLVHKERVYAANIIDASDVDAAVKVTRTGFGPDGNADPHRFRESFYVGGSSKGGDIRGFKLLNDQIYIFLRRSAWRFSPSSGAVGDLQQLGESIGVLAPYSLVECGNFLMFLSERGVYAFDGVNFVHVSEKVDDDILSGGNLDRLVYAKAQFNAKDNQYVLYYAHGSSTRNNRALIYDLRLKCWQPPVTGRYVNYISTYDNADGLERIVIGDYMGYLYEDSVGLNDGIESGYNFNPASATYSTVTHPAESLTTAGDGLAGIVCRIISGQGEGQERIIASNTSAVITLESNWDIAPNSASVVTVGAIDADWRSKDYEFGNHDIVKLFRHARVRVREEGNFSLTMHYIVDFRELANATSNDILLLDKGFCWDTSRWDTARWDPTPTIRRKVSLRNTKNQPTNGTHLALRFSNRRANESFRLSGYDIELKPLGKR